MFLWLDNLLVFTSLVRPKRNFKLKEKRENKHLLKKIILQSTNLRYPGPKTSNPFIGSPIIISEFFFTLWWRRWSVIIVFHWDPMRSVFCLCLCLCLSNLLLPFLELIIIGGLCTSHNTHFKKKIHKATSISHPVDNI